MVWGVFCVSVTHWVCFSERCSACTHLFRFLRTSYFLNFSHSAPYILSQWNALVWMVKEVKVQSTFLWPRLQFSFFLAGIWCLISLLIVLVCRSDIPKSLSCLVIFTLNLSSNHLMINPFSSSFSPHLLSLGRPLFSIFQAHLFEQQGSCQLLWRFVGH